MTKTEKDVKRQQPKNQKYAGKAMTKGRYIRTQMKRNWVGYAMVAPFLFMFIVFTVVPVVLSILLSFTSFNMLQVPEWKGLENYVQLFLADDLFITAFSNTMLFAITTGPASFILAFTEKSPPATLPARFAIPISPKILSKFLSPFHNTPKHFRILTASQRLFSLLPALYILHSYTNICHAPEPFAFHQISLLNIFHFIDFLKQC